MFILTIGIFLIGVIISFLAYSFFSRLDSRDRFKQTMRRAQGYTNESQREVDLNASFVSRTFGKFFIKIIPAVSARAPSSYMDNVRKKMIKLGKPKTEAVENFIVVKALFLIPALVTLYWLLASFLANRLSFFTVAIGMFLMVIFLFGPDLYIRNRVDARREAISQQLPDILDLLTISVEAGLGFEQAVDRVVSNVPGPLSDEMGRMLGETRSGMTRADALRALDRRVEVPEVRSFVMAIIQADKFGVSVGTILRSQSEEMRIKRRQLAEEKAQKAPIKLLAPMMICIFPVLFIVILSPAALKIFGIFSSGQFGG